MVFIPAHAGYAPSSNYATPDRRATDVPCVDFDDTTAETYYYLSKLPDTYAGGGLTFKLTFAMTSATSGDVQFDLAFERFNTDLDSTSFSAATAGTQTVSATNGTPVVCTIIVTDGANMDSIAAGEMFRFSVTRNTGGSDTATGDAELIGISHEET